MSATRRLQIDRHLRARSMLCIKYRAPIQFCQLARSGLRSVILTQRLSYAFFEKNSRLHFLCMRSSLRSTSYGTRRVPTPLKRVGMLVIRASGTLSPGLVPCACGIARCPLITDH